MTTSGGPYLSLILSSPSLRPSYLPGFRGYFKGLSSVKNEKNNTNLHPDSGKKYMCLILCLQMAHMHKYW